MKLDKCVERCMDAQGGLITAADIQQLGYNRGVLHTYTNAGLLERYECGVYVRPGTLVDDMLYLQRKYPTLVFSHESALFLHGLSERTPFSHSVTIPSSATLPRSLARVCTCFYIKPELHELGLTHLPTPFGNSVRCYDAERSICDLLRNRNRVDVESFSAAMKRYFSTSSVNLHRLADYASRLGVMNNLTPYLELLV